MTAKQKFRSLRWKIAKAMLTKEERNMMRVGYAIGIKEYKDVDMTDELRIGDEVYVKAVIDEIRRGYLICKNKHGYFYTVTRDDLATETRRRGGRMSQCYNCGFWDDEREGCACPSYDMWYACPIESEKPENKQALEEFANWKPEGKRLEE